jgi:hypothetical protein
MMRATPVDAISVKGEIGRRIYSVIRDNIYQIDHQKDFLMPFYLRNNHAKVRVVSLLTGIFSHLMYSFYTPNSRSLKLQ